MAVPWLTRRIFWQYVGIRSSPATGGSRVLYLQVVYLKTCYVERRMGTEVGGWQDKGRPKWGWMDSIRNDFKEGWAGDEWMNRAKWLWLVRYTGPAQKHGKVKKKFKKVRTSLLVITIALFCTDLVICFHALELKGTQVVWPYYFTSDI